MRPVHVGLELPQAVETGLGGGAGGTKGANGSLRETWVIELLAARAALEVVLRADILVSLRAVMLEGEGAAQQQRVAQVAVDELEAGGGSTTKTEALLIDCP